jgi:hypothetical protein
VARRICTDDFRDGMPRDDEPCITSDADRAGEEKDIGFAHPFAKVCVPIGDHTVVRCAVRLNLAPSVIRSITEHPGWPVRDGLPTQAELFDLILQQRHVGRLKIGLRCNHQFAIDALAPDHGGVWRRHCVDWHAQPIHLTRELVVSPRPIGQSAQEKRRVANARNFVDLHAAVPVSMRRRPYQWLEKSSTANMTKSGSDRNSGRSTGNAEASQVAALLIVAGVAPLAVAMLDILASGIFPRPYATAFNPTVSGVNAIPACPSIHSSILTCHIRSRSSGRRR